mgnify:CR=1 FL=1
MTMQTKNRMEVELTDIGGEYLGKCDRRIEAGDALVIRSFELPVVNVKSGDARDELSVIFKCANPNIIALDTYSCAYQNNKILVKRVTLGSRDIVRGSAEFEDYQRQLAEAKE